VGAIESVKVYGTFVYLRLRSPTESSFRSGVETTMTIAETYTKAFTAPGVSVEVAQVMIESMRANSQVIHNDGEGQDIFMFSDNSSIKTRELWAHKNKQNNL
jgi:hypothetical protein